MNAPTPNGKHDPILEAERGAEAQQGAIPPPYEPPEPPAAAPPKALALFSVEWFDAEIAAHEELLRQKYAALTATQEYADWQSEHGATQHAKAQRDLLLRQRAAETDAP